MRRQPACARVAVASSPRSLEEQLRRFGLARAHYADTPPAYTLHPCGLGTQADMGPGTQECANQLALLIATRRNGGQQPTQRLLDAVRREVHGRLGVALMRELAGQIIKTFAGSPRAGLTQDNAYVHSMFRRGAAGEVGACTCDPAAPAGRLAGGRATV